MTHAVHIAVKPTAPDKAETILPLAVREVAHAATGALRPYSHPLRRHLMNRPWRHRPLWVYLLPYQPYHPLFTVAVESVIARTIIGPEAAREISLATMRAVVNHPAFRREGFTPGRVGYAPANDDFYTIYAMSDDHMFLVTATPIPGLSDRALCAPLLISPLRLAVPRTQGRAGSADRGCAAPQAS